MQYQSLYDNEWEKSGWWDDSYEKNPMRMHIARQALRMMKRHNVRGKLIEFGCGNSLLLKIIPREGNTLFGADVSAVALKKARKNISRHVRLLKSDITDKDNLPEGKFDAIFLLAVLEHVSEDSLSLKNLYNLLENGGKLIIEVPMFGGRFREYEKLCKHVRYYERKSLFRLINEAGFKIREYRFWGFPFDFLYMIYVNHHAKKYLIKSGSGRKKKCKKGTLIKRILYKLFLLNDPFHHLGTRIIILAEKA